MSKVTAQELSLLRTQPHSTKLWLSVYQPDTRFAARVNDGDIAKGERLITYDSLSAGSHLLVEAGMTLWVGSSGGADDKGKVRVRSITSSVITVAENDHIDWDDGDYLTIVAFFEINAVFPRIIQDPSDELDVIFYKDYDIAYTDQNEVLGSFVCMGPHYAGFLESGSRDVYYSASGTSNVKGDNLTYSWFFQGATTTGSSSQNPGNITYDTPGHYTTRLQVTNASGGVDTSYRHISIYDRPESGSTIPILSWELGQLSGSRQKGGYTGRIKIRQAVDNDLIKDGSLIVIFADDRYGEVIQSIGGNAEGRASIVFVGYVLDGSIEYNYADSSVEFEFGSPTEVMKIAEGFSISVHSKASPSTWFELLNMNAKRAMYHYLRWHSTYLMTNDIAFGGTDQNLQFFDADRESLYDAVKTPMSGALVGSAVSDRQGKLWMEVDGYTAGITLENTFTLDKQDWVGDPSLEQAQNYSLSFIEGGGIAYVGPDTTDFTAHMAAAPGDAPAYRGKLNRFQGLALSSQAQLNQLVGDIFAHQNSEFPSSIFLLAGNYRNFDIAPQEIVSINLRITDTVREISFFGREFLISAVDWLYSPREEYFQGNISFFEKTSGVAGDTIDIPDVPDVGGFGNTPPFEFPPFDFPPFDFESAIDLYDEGTFQGSISEIDFVGSPVVAAQTNEYGTVTITFPGGLTGNDAIGTSRRSATSLGAAIETILDEGSDNYTNGVTIDSVNHRIIFQVPGVYIVQASGQFGNNEPVWISFLCANQGSDYGGPLKINHYNSADGLIAEYEEPSGRAYCFESPATGEDVPVHIVGVSITRTFSVSSGDYVQFTFTPSAALSGSPDIDISISVFRIT